MSEIAKSVGQRIRNYRTQQGLSQEKLAELSGCHPTYIGQLERGEKNATLESIDKIATALNVSLSKLFEKLGGQEDGDKDIPLEVTNFFPLKRKRNKSTCTVFCLKWTSTRENKHYEDTAENGGILFFVCGHYYTYFSRTLQSKNAYLEYKCLINYLHMLFWYWLHKKA